MPTNNRLGWKGLPEASTLAYYETVTYSRKKFYSIVPWLKILVKDKRSSLFYQNMNNKKGLIMLTPEGRCDEEKDLAILDLTKLFRKPYWSERNPGRKRLDNAKEHQVTF